MPDERAKVLPGSVPDNAIDIATARLTRDMMRSRRHREVRAITLPIKNSIRRVAAESALYPEDVDADRPRTRGDCDQVERPCPYVGCRHHLYLDVNEKNGAIKLNFPDLEPDELLESCSLDMAELGPSTLEETGAVLNITRERVRQLAERTERRLRFRLRVWQDHEPTYHGHGADFDADD
jgi:hypothetical protein